MSYGFEKLSDIKAIKIIVTSTLDQDDRKILHLKATSYLSLSGYNRLLIDVRKSILPGNFSPLNSVDMANYMKEFVFHKNTKIAYLCIGNSDARKDFVKIAKANGINIEYFTELSDAKTWLQ